MECNTCYNTVNFLTTCTKCSYQTCRTCLGIYTCSSINEPSCMNCKHPLTRDFLIANIGIGWYDGKYKDSRKDVLLQREISLFPATYDFAIQYKNISANETLLYKMKSEYNITHQKFKELSHSKMDKKTKSELPDNLTYKGFYKYKKEYKENVSRIVYCNRQVKKGLEPELQMLKKKSITQKSKMYTKCPLPECPGLLGDDYKCIACNVKTCNKCFEIIKLKPNEEHVCNQETIDTIALLQKDTKPCPKCSTLIHRIEGCYQMWCTCCHVTFHYNTLEILNEKIHNPHYTDWLKNNVKGITTVVNNCGGELGYNSFNSLKYNDKLYTMCFNTYRQVLHIENVTLPLVLSYINKTVDIPTRRIERTKFMLKKIDKKTFQTFLFRSYKQQQRWSEVRDLLNMYIDAVKIILTNTIISNDEYTFMNEHRNITDYANSELLRIHKLYTNTWWFRFNHIIQLK
jgi:hypothetical protein